MCSTKVIFKRFLERPSDKILIGILDVLELTKPLLSLRYWSAFFKISYFYVQTLYNNFNNPVCFSYFFKNVFEISNFLFEKQNTSCKSGAGLDFWLVVARYLQLITRKFNGFYYLVKYLTLKLPYQH